MDLTEGFALKFSVSLKKGFQDLGNQEFKLWGPWFEVSLLVGKNTATTVSLQITSQLFEKYSYYLMNESLEVPFEFLHCEKEFIFDIAIIKGDLYYYLQDSLRTTKREGIYTVKSKSIISKKIKSLQNISIEEVLISNKIASSLQIHSIKLNNYIIYWNKSEEDRLQDKDCCFIFSKDKILSKKYNKNLKGEPLMVFEYSKTNSDSTSYETSSEDEMSNEV